MKIVYHNVSGIKSQANSIRPQIDTCHYDVIVLTETWFDQTVCSSNFFNPQEWQVFRRDRCESGDSRRGGGVIIAICRIYFSYAIDVTLHEAIPTGDGKAAIEQAWATIETDGRRLHISAMYIPPAQCPAYTFELPAQP